MITVLLLMRSTIQAERGAGSCAIIGPFTLLDSSKSSQCHSVVTEHSSFADISMGDLLFADVFLSPICFSWWLSGKRRLAA